MEPTIFSFSNMKQTGCIPLGAIAFKQDGGSFNSALLHDLELLVLVICDKLDSTEIDIEHYISGTTQYQVRYIGKTELKRWSISGEQREIIRCFRHGEIIWDAEGEVAALRNELVTFGDDVKVQRKLKEFARFLSSCLEAKRFALERDYMDAYYSVLESLKHYARIELIDHGVAPENCVWEQIRSINTVVYKLFNELTDSEETLEQRIELVLIACDFFIMSRMEDCCALLLNILGSRKEPWSIKELIALPELRYVKEELPMMIRKLVYRSLIKQTAGDWSKDSREIRYWV